MEKYEMRLGLREKSTQKNYRSAFNKFMLNQSLTTEDLLKMDTDEVGLRVQMTMKAERDAGKKPTTSYMIYKAVRFFMKSAGKNLILEREDKPRLVYNGSRGVTEGEIRELYDAFGRANFRIRNQAILLFLKDSGLRISDLARLDVSLYREAEEIADRDDYDVQRGERFKVFDPFETKKTGDYAHIVIGPESVKAVDDYLGERREGPLFLSAKGGRLSTKALSELFRTLRVKGRLKGNFSKVSAHSLRKFHYTKLQHIGEKLVFYLEGKTGYTYEKPSKRDYIEPYIKNYDRLRVFGSAEAQVKELKANLERRDSEMEALKDKIEALTLSTLRSEQNFKNIDKILRTLKIRGEADMTPEDAVKWDTLVKDLKAEKVKKP
jgi:integrase